MKQASPELIAFLASRSDFLMADCFTFYLLDGTVLRYTKADVDVTVGANTWIAHTVLVSGLKYTVSIGVDVDEQDITISARDVDMVGGVPFLVALRNGAFRSCYIQRDRAFLSAWGQPAIGAITLFHGRISTIDKIDSTTADVKVKSDLVLLDQDFPRNIYQPSCLHTFCGPGCGIVKSSIAVEGTATGGDYSSVVWGGATEGKFAQGTIEFRTGANAGVFANIKQSTGTGLIFSYPLEFPVGAGDAFIATPGCAHTLAACALFGGNFRGYPNVPPPETAY